MMQCNVKGVVICWTLIESSSRNMLLDVSLWDLVSCIIRIFPNNFLRKILIIAVRGFSTRHLIRIYTRRDSQAVRFLLRILKCVGSMLTTFPIIILKLCFPHYMTSRTCQCQEDILKIKDKAELIISNIYLN